MIPAVTATGAALPTMPTTTVGTSAIDGVGTGTATGATNGSGFTQQIGHALDNLQATQGSADALARQAAVGQLQDPSQYMIAATQASLATELTVAVRNKAVEAFNSIMSMGV